jgi:hypothetical protein
MKSKLALQMTAMLLALAFVIFATSSSADEFPPGDANGTGAVDIDDVVYIVAYIFSGGPAPVTPEAGDANCIEGTDIDDVVYLIAFIFSNGPEPCAYENPSGSVVGYTGCKPFGWRLGTPPEQDCLEWGYSNGVLQITHVNEGLNCCPVILADILIEGNVITIEEIDSLDMGGCACLCLFDVDYEIVNLAPGEYFITVIEPYVPPSEESLEFTVDLRTTPVGSYCVVRDFYPWLPLK